jgi:hypothetical protein
MNCARVLNLCILLLATTSCLAAATECPECGCCDRRVTCRLLCESQVVKETRWKCECEDFCIPGPSRPCGEDCECDSSKKSGLWCIRLWQPGCAKVRTRQILGKEETKRTVPSHRWVVEEVCDCCGCFLGEHTSIAKESEGLKTIVRPRTGNSERPVRRSSKGEE